MSSKELWKVVKPYLNKNACFNGGSIILEEGSKIISNEEKLVEIFNDHYINIVKIPQVRHQCHWEIHLTPI